MSEKRFIRNIEGNIYDIKNHKFIKEDWKGKHLDYEDDLVVLLNELAEENEKLKEKLYIVETDCKNVKESRNHYRKENELLKQDNQRQKTLRNKHWREIQARANGYNRIISSLEDIIPQPMIEELRNAPLLDCDYEGVESNE